MVVRGFARVQLVGTVTAERRLRPMRGFERAGSADTISRGHGLVQNLRNGFSALVGDVPRQLRLMTAWTQLALMI